MAASLAPTPYPVNARARAHDATPGWRGGEHAVVHFEFVMRTARRIRRAHLAPTPSRRVSLRP